MKTYGIGTCLGTFCHGYFVLQEIDDTRSHAYSQHSQDAPSKKLHHHLDPGTTWFSNGTL